MVTLLATIMFTLIVIFIIWLMIEAMYHDYNVHKFRDGLKCGDAAYLNREIVTVTAIDKHHNKALVSTLFHEPVWVSIERLYSPYQQSLVSFLYHTKLKLYFSGKNGKNKADI